MPKYCGIRKLCFQWKQKEAKLPHLHKSIPDPEGFDCIYQSFFIETVCLACLAQSSKMLNRSKGEVCALC